MTTVYEAYLQLVATDEDNITCDNADEVSEYIQKKGNEVVFTDVVCKKSD